jgi:hypothetical protein
MRKLLFMLILGTSTCWAVSGCDGAGNCYVRSSATGAGNGSDWTNAYTSLPASLTRGVIYYVAAGRYPGHTFADADSGTATISILAATAASHGTATGWSSSYVGQATFTCSSSCGDIIVFAADYYVFSGVYRSTATGNPETDWVLESGYGFKVDNSNSNAGGAIAAGSGYKGATCGSLPACNAIGMFVHDITASYVDLNGAHPSNDSDDIDIGFDVEGGSYNITMTNNYVHDDAVPNYIRGSHGHQAGGGYYFGTGDSNTIEYTYIQHNYSSPTYHSEACSCSEGLTNFTLRYNYFDQIGGVGGNGSTSHIGTASGADYNNGNGPNGPWYIYGNVFTCSATTPTMNCAVGDGVLAVWDASFTGAVYFLNNTIYDIGPHSLEGLDGLGLAYTTPMTAVYIENNLLFDNDSMTDISSGTKSYDGATFTSFTWGYNSYFQTPTAGAADTDSNKQVSSANPFSGSVCCTLASDTAAGTNTNSLLAENATDMFGVTRGANGTWDRGALQISGSDPPSPPTNLAASVH